MTAAHLPRMRCFVICVLLIAPSALAQSRGNGLSWVDVENTPAVCRTLATLADSPSENQALSARIALADCLASERTRPLVLCDCELSIRELDDASTQSVALLDEAAQVGDASMRILALGAKADLLAGFAARILATVPAASGHGDAALELRALRLATIGPLVAPWEQQARSAYREIDRIARANPQLTNKNPAVSAAVRTGRDKLAKLDAGIARR